MSIPVERRASARHAVSCPAALASGSAVAAVRIADLSDKGCRALVLDGRAGLPSGFGGTGLLAIQAPGRARAGAVVPVMLRHTWTEAGVVQCGLEFRPMTPRQARRLAAVVADLVAGPAPARVTPPGAGRAAVRA